jgi:hypothetical protein
VIVNRLEFVGLTVILIVPPVAVGVILIVEEVVTPSVPVVTVKESRNGPPLNANGEIVQLAADFLISL